METHTPVDHGLLYNVLHTQPGPYCSAADSVALLPHNYFYKETNVTLSKLYEVINTVTLCWYVILMHDFTHLVTEKLLSLGALVDRRTTMGWVASVKTC